MKLLIIILLTNISLVTKSDTLFSHGFDQRIVQTQFPLVDGEYLLPETPATEHLKWIIQQVNNTTINPKEIAEHFDLDYLIESNQDIIDYIL